MARCNGHAHFSIAYSLDCVLNMVWFACDKPYPKHTFGHGVMSKTHISTWYVFEQDIMC